MIRADRAMDGVRSLARFEWTEAMSVGVPSLDADHKAMIRIINLLCKIDEEGGAQTMDVVLDTLVAYSQFHFGREERVMEVCGFPETLFHRTEHAGFAEYVRRLRNLHGGVQDPAVVAELLEYLSDWLRHHILIQDMAYKPFVLDDPEAERAARAFAGGHRGLDVPSGA